MSQERETKTQDLLDPDEKPPQGDGWTCGSPVYYHDETGPCLTVVWVREPVPDAWQDFENVSGVFAEEHSPGHIFVDAKSPEGFKPLGPWKQYAATGVGDVDGDLDGYQDGSSGGKFRTTCSRYTHWRRPLRKIKGGEG
jgi:hypothetical protein